MNFCFFILKSVILRIKSELLASGGGNQMNMKKRESHWHGTNAIMNASQVILELEGINGQLLSDCIDPTEVSFIQKCAKPNKKTILHDYIEDVYYFQLEYVLDKHFPMEIIKDLKELLDFYHVDFSELGDFQYFEYEDEDLDYEETIVAEEYAWKLLKFFWENIGELVVDDIFTVLYGNRHFMFEFNTQLAEIVLKLKHNDYPDYLKKDGVFKRGYIPKWLQNGVFMRDKGRCQVCSVNLSKILNIDDNENYDHIIPLEIGGTNDPVNFQLTCERCNKSKGAKNIGFNSLANRYWKFDLNK